MKKNGFTLIELLVSMGIIAVLSAMAVFNFNQARMRARDVQRKSDLSQLQKALELYKNDHKTKYPVSFFGEDLQDIYLLPNGYTKVKFVDPQGDTWFKYVYASTDGITYTLTACLENISDSTRKMPVETCGHASLGVKYVISNP